MQPLSSKKLLHSKWTAVKPKNKEKHFMVIDVLHDETAGVVECEIEAVLTRRSQIVDWQDLKDPSRWRQGWR